MISEIIYQIEEVFRQQAFIAEKERLATRPLLTDPERIPVLYGWFCEIMKSGDIPPCTGGVIQRKKFLFIALFLYSPGVLNGKPMVRGLRDKLAEVLNVASRTTISDNCADVITFYHCYPGYRDEIDKIYEHLYKRIREADWIGTPDFT